LTHSLQPAAIPIHPETITPENFAPYGQIIQAHPDPATRKEGMIVQSNPAANVEKYCRLADVTSTYPEGAYTGIGVYRATKKVGLERGRVFDVRLMERHMYTSQAFIPMAKGDVSLFNLWRRMKADNKWPGKGEEALPAGGEFLVIVAQNGKGRSFLIENDARD
jgi:allantoicase